MRAPRHGLLLPALAALLGCTTLSGEEEPTARVSYADLDLKLPADRRVLSRRLDAASLRYCRQVATIRRLPPHYARSHPGECLVPVRKELLRSSPPAVRAALR